MKLRAHGGIFCCLGLALVVAGASCKPDEPPSLPQPQPVKPAENTLAVKPRLVSLSPSITETLFALGVGDLVIGVSSADNYPSETQKLPKAGDFASPNMEALLALKPTDLFATQVHPKNLEQKIRDAGINLWLFPQAGFEDVYFTISEVGKIVGASEEAEALVESLRARERQVTDKTRQIPLEERYRAFIELSDDLYTAGQNTFLDELTRKAGGVNIAATLSQEYPKVTSEFVIQANPDIILLTYVADNAQSAAAASVAARAGWKGIKAVAAGRIICDISPDLLSRPGPRLIDALEALATRMRPPSSAESG